MSKKTWILISCLVLSLSLGLGGSLAYLTDTDTKVNTFTMGNVDIEVEEDFDLWAAEHLKPGVNIQKAAKIVNTGDNDAWVWMEIAVPSELRNYIELYGEWNTELDHERCCHEIGIEPDGWDDNGEPNSWNVWRNVTGDDGKQYDVITILVNEQLPVGEETHNLLHSVKLNEFVDKRSDGTWWYVRDGQETKLDFDGNHSFNIVVSGFALQADGVIDGVEQAYQLYNQQWGDQQVPNIDSDDKNTWMVHSTEELQDLLTNDPNNKVITLADGEYDPVTLGDAENLTIRSAVNTSPVMHGLTIKAGAKIEGLWIENLEFNDKGIEFEFDVRTAPWTHVHDLHVTNCEYRGEKTADGGSLVSIRTSSPGSHQLHNVYIYNCRVYGANQGFLLGGFAEDCEVKIVNNYFEDIYHNAIALRSGMGDILVEDNHIVRGSDTAATFRIGTLTAPVSVTYKNNKIEDTNTENSMYYEANTVPEGSVVFEGNTVDGADWNPLQ
ncbi:MAG: hypothetical protein IJA83_12475 [Clostridia bacterium]|nr:hypothetical protein [Clostridia bacterium]